MNVMSILMGKFKDAVSLDTHIHQLQNASATAQAEKEHWQAQAKAAESRTKGRISSIKTTEKLLANGIKLNTQPAGKKGRPKEYCCDCEPARGEKGTSLL